MAQDAELKLKVSLDLAFFRQQLAGLGQAAAGYNIPVQVKFDRRSIQNELNALGANIRRRNYRLEVNTNLSAEIKKARDLADALKGLEGKIKAGSGGFSQSQQGAAGLMEFMRSQGLSGGGGFVGVGRSVRLQNALEALTVKRLQALAKSESIGGVSRLKKDVLIDKLMNNLSQQAMENILGNAQMALRRPVRGIFTPGRTIAQGPLQQFSMAAQTQGSMGQFPMAGMMGPSSPLTINARSSMFTGGGGGNQPPGGGGLGGFGQFGRAMGGANLPGTGTVREIGSEFAFAAKQVLLFGTAYKALAFIQDFPSQVAQAVGQLQSFRNTLNAISPSAKEAAASNQLILNLVERYNIPLQSARDGFTKLYASMQPAGFSGDEIRGLFTGISKAAATFGMSADKVDRVNYAFAQMASKGQVMSEELKGQLGDVLPGAMAIFAEAAGFKGPKALQEFSKALEDGRYKGLAMVDLLNNVGVLLNTKFAAGAEGAAKTFQGAMNNMQTSSKLFYEAFEPAAASFLNSFVNPISDQLKILADGFSAFFKGTAAKTSGGIALANELENLKPSFEGILANLRGLIPVIQTFGNLLAATAKFALSLASDPLVGYFVKLYAIILPLNIAFGVLRSALVSNIGQFVLFNAQILLGTTRTAALRTTIALTGGVAATTTGAIRTLNLSITSLASRTIIGAAIVGLSMLIEKFATAGIAAENAKQKMLSFADSVKSAGEAADVGGLKATLSAEKLIARRLKDAQVILKQIQAGKGEITAAQAEELKSLGLASNMTFARQRTSQGSNVQVQVGAPGAVGANIQAAQKGYGEAQTRILQTQNALNTALSKQVNEEKKLRTIREGEADQKGGKMSLQDLVGPGIVQAADLEKAQTKLAVSQMTALAPDTAQSKRMIGFFDKVRQNEIEQLSILTEIKIVEKNTGAYLRMGVTQGQIRLRIDELRNQLAIRQIELASDEQDYRNQAKKDADEELKQVNEKIRKQRDLIRLLEDARIASGAINPQQAAAIRQRREFEDAQFKAQELGASPTQMAALQASQAATPIPGSLQAQFDKLKQELEEITSLQSMVKEGAKGIGEAFGNSFKQIANGSMTAQEALASFFQNVGDYFLDMTARMIAKWMEMEAIGLVKNLLSGLAGAAGGGNTAMPFVGAGLGGGGTNTFAYAAGAPKFFANGGIAKGGFVPFRAFAEGGMVAGPTLGLVGEGKYNEAIIPMPNGKSVPVDLQGAAPGNQIVSNITVNVSNGKAETQGGAGGGADLSRKLEGAVKQVIIGELRPGGVLAGKR